MGSLDQAFLPTLSTERLALRPVEVGDLRLMVELNADPRVMTFIRGRAATPEETHVEWRQRLQHQSDAALGLGYWAGFEAGAFVGWWSASSFEGRPEISGIGYRLRPQGWGRGLATEGARVMVEQAFACAEVQQVFASTKAANVGSRRVLEKLGMTHTATWGDEDSEVSYDLGRSDWAEGANRER